MDSWLDRIAQRWTAFVNLPPTESLRWLLLVSLTVGLILLGVSLATAPLTDQPGRQPVDQLSALTHPAAATTGWSMFRGAPAHTGYVSVVGPATATLVWRFQAAHGGQGPPPNSVALASDGTIYLGGPEQVFALNHDGSIKWARSEPNTQGPALSADERTVYLAATNALLALDAATGGERWRVPTGGATLFGPTLAPDGTLYQGSWDGYLWAIDASGRLKWRFKTAGALSYPPSLGADGTIYLGGGDAHAGPDRSIYALHPDGSLRWRYDSQALRSGTPAIASDGTLYVPVAPALIALHPDGSLVWRLGPTVTQTSWFPHVLAAEPGLPATSKGDVTGIITPALGATGQLYSVTSEGLVLAIDPRTQTIRWSVATGPSRDDPTHYGIPAFPVVDVNDTVYVGSVDGVITAIDRTGQVRWRYQTGGPIAEAAPALGPDGTLYVSSADGYLYAFRSSAK